MAGVFDQARACIGSAVIEQLLHAPGAEWRGDEYFTLNPVRADGRVGSFSINEAGLWHDFATDESGDLIDLVAAMRGIGKREAAEAIVMMTGGTVEDRPVKTKAKREKPDPRIPAPETALKALNGASSSAWVVERHGRPVRGWTYRTAEGGVAFAVTRHEKPDGSKDILPWYFGVDDRWHQGQAYETGRPLYRLDQIVRADRGTPILVVEGEKCASVDVPGYLVTTWAGGASATARTDWSPIEGRTVIVWPDADAAGAKAAAAIARRLPGAKVLQVAGRPSGWDLADAVAEGVDPVAFIASAMPAGEAAEDGSVYPFVVLGHDAVAHYFMRREIRLPFAIGRGSFNQSKLLEIAPLAWWQGWGEQMVTNQGGIKVAAAQDLLTELSMQAGTYDQTRLRGAGVWRDADGIVLNDGQRLILPDGEALGYDEYRTEYVYVKSSVRFGAMSGPESTDEDGRTLEALFRAQSWADMAMAPLAMGWSLIAPFGGMLKWRPHIWLSGRKGSGKSFMLENLIAPLCGPFAHKGSGKDTEAGIRRSLNMDARQVILDEVEPKSAKAREKITSLLELARNASSDGSGVITIGGGVDGGAVTFVIRSCFAFASVQVPDEDAAVSSRIIRMELRAEDDQAGKFRRCAELYAECMQDPARYTRRIYRALPRILSDIEWIRTAYLGAFGEQRKVDQVAPLLAAAWAAQSGETIQHSSAGRAWLDGWIGWLASGSVDAVEDEDAVVRHLIAAQIRTDEGVNRTVAELLIIAAQDMIENAAGNLLSRNGIRMVTHYGRPAVAVSIDNPYVRRILAGTPYESGYGAQLRRNKLCVEQSKPVRFACGQSRACLIEWDGFRAQYLDDAVTPELPDDPPF